MSKPKTANQKIKYGTQLPPGMPEKIKEYSAREGMFADQIFASALELWFDAMDGRGAPYKPTHAEHHRRLEVLLNSKDPAVLEALGGVLAVCERLVTARQTP